MTESPPIIYPQGLYNKKFKNPFICRPWLVKSGGAASAKQGKGLKGVVAGGLTGGIEVCITYPTEYVKTQLQLDEKGDKKKYKGIWDCCVKTVQTKGVLGLYRGLSILLYGSIPKSGVRFGAFEFYRGLLVDERNQLPPSKRVLAGLGAGITEAILVVTPMETIKVKLINDLRNPVPQYHGLFHGIKTIVKTDGVSGIYKGVTATVLKQGSNQAIRFYVMETLKDLYRGGDPEKKVPSLMVGVFGAIAGLASVYGNNPVDVVKTRMQGLEAAQYKGTVDCAMKILRNEGPLAFYKGTIPRLSRVCIDVALTFMIYDAFMLLFEKIWP